MRSWAFAVLLFFTLLPNVFGLIAVSGGLHLQIMQPMPSSDSGSTMASQSNGRCESLAETPPVVRCGLMPSDDTFVDNFFPDKTFAMSLGNPLVPMPVLIVQDTTQYHATYGNLSLNYAYLKFSLTSLLPTELLSSHAEPRNATLWLYVRWISLFYNASIRVYSASSNDWEENKLTWNARPGFDKTIYSETTIRANGTWARWDVSEQVRLALREGSQVSFVVTGSETSWRNVIWFDSKDHPQEGNIWTRPELDLDFEAPVLTIHTPYPNLPISVGKRNFQTNPNGMFQAYLTWGTYEVGVPEVIPKGEGARAAFVGWNDNVHEPKRVITVGNNVTLSASYEMEYYLDVKSQYGSANGSGWYHENQEARASVLSGTIVAEGLPGMLGVRHVFDHWTGDCSGAEHECTITMDGPKQVGAIWRDDYTITIFGAILLIVATGAAIALNKRRKRPASSP